MNIIDINNLSETENKYDIIKNLFDGDCLDVEFYYRSNYKNTKHLRDFVEEIGEILELSDKIKSRLVLISDELNNNAIEYGSSEDWSNIMRINICKEGEIVNFNLEVEDDWKWREHKTALDMETMRAHQLKLWYFNHDSIRWRGLFLITVKIVDRLYFRNSKNWGLIVGIRAKLA